MMTMGLEWGYAAMAMGATQESGDAHVVHAFPGGSLVSVVDGLGHGPEAATAARRCAALLVERAGDPLEELVSRCHEWLRGTRGVALAVVSFTSSTSTMSWLGVGNVMALLVRGPGRNAPSHEFLLQRNGVVGARLSRLSAATLPVQEGDTLILATDGIREDFHEDLNVAVPPQQLADRILARSQKATDDALVLVVRYVGGSS